ncbi:outer dense fiber protein 4 isoform X1 [Symphalangus syndactylus]|uniref:outer dense fiber protein 4 isoform X1 n=2 Tax=Symphalangus syndactylus TaxID=9590 RepID=UPI002441AD2B|nr:outer dense fiber protein 4 isoform X1 [Symphalangus syndactylus]
MDAEDSGNEFPRSEGERDQHQRPGKERKSGEAGWGTGELGQDGRLLSSTLSLSSNRSSSQRRNSPLPFQWRITHSFRWMAQVLASELSLIAFILLLVMAFSKKWLYLSRSRFYQRWPVDVSNRIHTSAHIMSRGLLHFCKSRSCSDLENGKDSFKLWTNQPMFKVAKISFNLTLGLGLVLTIWLHLPYLPAVQKLPFVGLVGTILSFCEVTFIFSTLMLFPINIWIFEVERNVSIPIGWSYFIGWLVLILYITCAILCYFNYKSFWSLILSHPSGAVSCSSSFRSVEESPRAQTITDTPITQEGVLDPEQKETHV